MANKKLIMNREFCIHVYNELCSGKSYPDIAEEMDIPVIKAFPAFQKAEEEVKNSPKMQFECLVYKKAKNDILAKEVIGVLKSYNYNTIGSLKPLTELSFKEIWEEVNRMSENMKVREVIFSLIRHVKGV